MDCHAVSFAAGSKLLSVNYGEHRHYLADPIRMAAWARALDAVDLRDKRVLDLAAGTGILGLLALQRGARRVFAVDFGGIAKLSGAVAEENGFADRVHTIQAFSTDAVLPEPVDVIVADQIGYFGFNAGIFEYFADATRRFLAPGGITLPYSITLQCAAVEAPADFDRLDFWRTRPAGFGMKAFWEAAIQSPHAMELTAGQLLTDPVESPELLLHPTYAGMARLGGAPVAVREGTVHGLAGFFTATLAPGVTMSNSPLAAVPIQRFASFLPVERPFAVQAGEPVPLQVLVRPADQLVSWSAGGCRHSNFQNLDLGAADPGARPVADVRTHARRFVLDRFDGVATLGEIAAQLQAAFPELVPTREAALRFAGKLADGG